MNCLKMKIYDQRVTDTRYVREIREKSPYVMYANIQSMSQYYAVQTRQGQERSVVDGIMDSDVPGVYSALAPGSMKSYVIVEAEEQRLVEEATAGMAKVNKVLAGETSFYEVKGFLEPDRSTVDVAEGSLVEIQKGAYKGDMAKVTRVIPAEEKVRVELEDGPVPIPIEVPGDQIRVIEN